MRISEVIMKKRYELSREEIPALKKALEVIQQIENDEELSEAIRCMSDGGGDIKDTKEMIRTILNWNETDINL